MGHGNIESWQLGTLETLDTWEHRSLAIKNFGNLGPWKYGILEVQEYGNKGAWERRLVGTQICSCFARGIVVDTKTEHILETS